MLRRAWAQPNPTIAIKLAVLTARTRFRESICDRACTTYITAGQSKSRSWRYL